MFPNGIQEHFYSRASRRGEEFEVGSFVSPTSGARRLPPVRRGREVPARLAGSRTLTLRPGIRGEGGREPEVSLDEFLQLPSVRVYADFHCVTRWSRLDNVWGGVATRTVAGLVGLRAEARFVVAHAHDYGWTTNLPVEHFLAEDSLFAWSHDGEPIPPEHGGPVRLIVPRLYAWKSAKWVKGVRFLAEDEAGFWEEGGYHMRGNPWNGDDGERFRYQDEEE